MRSIPQIEAVLLPWNPNPAWPSWIGRDSCGIPPAWSSSALPSMTDSLANPVKVANTVFREAKHGEIACFLTRILNTSVTPFSFQFLRRPEHGDSPIWDKFPRDVSLHLGRIAYFARRDGSKLQTSDSSDENPRVLCSPHSPPACWWPAECGSSENAPLDLARRQARARVGGGEGQGVGTDRRWQSPRPAQHNAVRRRVRRRFRAGDVPTVGRRRQGPLGPTRAYRSAPEGGC